MLSFLLMLFVAGLALAILLTPVAVLVLLARTNALRRRVEALEGRAGVADPAAMAAPAMAVAPPANPPAPPASAPSPPFAAPPPEPPPPELPPPGAPPPAARAPVSLEERLGVRLAVWVGAIALALAGLFLVKYAFDHDLLGPQVRVALGLVFGAGLVAGGEWVRPRRSGRIGEGLSAAGIAVLYASFLAATDLYGLLPLALGFGLMALTTATAVALAVRQGPLIAAVGLVGGFLTPYLLRSDSPAAALPLFLYLLLLEVGLMAVSERRGWWPLALLTLAGGWAWVLLWLFGPFEAGDAALLYVFLAASTGAFLASRSLDAAEAWRGPRPALALGLAALTVPLLLAGLVTLVADFRPLDWLFLGLLGAGCLALARREPRHEPAAWFAALLTGLLLAAWYAAMPGGSALRADLAPRFAVAVGALGALYSLGAYAALWGAVAPARWAALSASAAVGYFLVAAVWLLDEGQKLAAAGLALALAAALVGLAVPVARRRADLPDGGLALAALATGATALLSLAVPLALERAWIGVAWALEVPLLLWIARRLEVPVLRRLAWPLALLVTLRLVANPALLDYPIGRLPLANWLSYGYGLPIAAFVLGAVWSRRDGDERLSELLQALAALLGFFLITLQVRQVFSPDDLRAPDWDRIAIEAASYCVVWLCYALGLLVLGRRLPARVATWAGALVVGAGLLGCFYGTYLLGNPWLRHQDLGAWPLLNGVLYVYGLPAALTLLAARELKRGPGAVAELATPLAAVGLFQVFVLITLLVRQAFHGPFLDVGGLEGAEGYAYSLAWGLYGLVLLALGIRGGSKLLRYASLVVMMVTVAKVFLVDSGNLTDLYRVGSYLGLGASLFALAWLYQRFVFRTESGR